MDLHSVGESKSRFRAYVTNWGVLSGTLPANSRCKTIALGLWARAT